MEILVFENFVKNIKRCSKAPIWMPVNYRRKLFEEHKGFFNMVRAPLEQLRLLHFFSLDSMTLWNILFHSFRSAISKCGIVKTGTGFTAIVIRVCCGYAWMDLIHDSMSSKPYTAFFPFQTQTHFSILHKWSCMNSWIKNESPKDVA